MSYYQKKYIIKLLSHHHAEHIRGIKDKTFASNTHNEDCGGKTHWLAVGLRGQGESDLVTGSSTEVGLGWGGSDSSR